MRVMSLMMTMGGVRTPCAWHRFERVLTVIQVRELRRQRMLGSLNTLHRIVFIPWASIATATHLGTARGTISVGFLDHGTTTMATISTIMNLLARWTQTTKITAPTATIVTVTSRAPWTQWSSIPSTCAATSQDQRTLQGIRSTSKAR